MWMSLVCATVWDHTHVQEFSELAPPLTGPISHLCTLKSVPASHLASKTEWWHGMGKPDPRA